MKVSLVITVLNEESTASWLLEGIQEQTLPPAEIILVDGGSSDGTVKIIQRWQKNSPIGKKITLLKKSGNRSIGRNFGIQYAKYPWIAITDAGCIPDKNWLKHLSDTQRQSLAQVIAGYYYGLPVTPFQQAVVPYVLVMPNKVNPKNFLPATRSMMMHKSVWKKIGGFDEQLKHNEDYAFAKKIERQNIPIAFARNALVGWLPRKNLPEFWSMIYRFALGDIQAGIFRPKIALIFARYAFFFGMFFWMAAENALVKTQSFFLSLIIIYSVWAVLKNKRFAPQGWLWLPLLQVTSDIAVMAGTAVGYIQKVLSKHK